MRDSDFPFFDRDPDESGAQSPHAATTDVIDPNDSDRAAAAQPASPERTRRSRTKKALLIAVIGLVVLALALGLLFGYYFKRVDSAIGSVEQENLMPAPYEGQPAPAPTAAGKNFLIVGADRNDNGSDGRSDVLMVAHLSEDRKNIYLVSFPRDMWVTIPANDQIQNDSKAKINAAYAWGRAPLAVKTVEQLTQVKIDHSAEVNFGGFIGLTEQLGGVTVDNKVASTSGPYSYPQGMITLSGEETLYYVRQRHGLPNGDFSRAERQRAVLSAILNKAMSPEILGNPIKFGELVNVASQQVTVDQTLPSSEVRELVFGLQIRERGQIHSLQAPVSGVGQSDDGQSIVLVDEARLGELSTAIREDSMEEYLAKYPGT